MRHGRTVAFVILALLAGGVLSQLPLAAADSDNPFGALWDAIFDLKSRDEQLQAQIDELRAEREMMLAQTVSELVLVGDLYATIDVEALEEGRTLVHIAVGNNGPDRVASVKLTAFYLMPLFEVNSIEGDLCIDKSRGIIECIIGTLEQDQEQVITIDATARESGKANTWTVDVSTTTDDSDYSNNHVTYDFETGSDEAIEIPEIEQPEEEPEVVEEEPEVTEPEQEVPSNNTESEETENVGNQTSEETQESSSNSTSTEAEEPESSESETADDSGSNSTSKAQDTESEQVEGNSEDAGSEDPQEEQPSESEPAQPAEDQSQDAQAPSEESSADESGDVGESSDESSEDASESAQEESSESVEESSGSKESSDSEENASDDSDDGQEVR
jgi:hypothetical protein